MAERYPKQIEYSEKYQDGIYEYRHVILPEALMKRIPQDRLLDEIEWRQLGVQQSYGWQHYMKHRPEKHILLFRRALGTNPQTGEIDPDIQREAKEVYEKHVVENSRSDR